MLRKLLVIGVVFASLGLAQGKKGRGGGGETASGGNMPSGMLSKFDRICTSLNLNKDQKKAAKTMLDEGNKGAAALRDQLTKSRIAVADAIQNKKSAEEITQAVNASAAVTSQLSQLELKAFAKIVASLDEAQKANQLGLRSTFALVNGIFRNKNWNED
jgi:hypothetical protein